MGWQGKLKFTIFGEKILEVLQYKVLRYCDITLYRKFIDIK